MNNAARDKVQQSIDAMMPTSDYFLTTDHKLNNSYLSYSTFIRGVTPSFFMVSREETAALCPGSQIIQLKEINEEHK